MRVKITINTSSFNEVDKWEQTPKYTTMSINDQFGTFSCNETTSLEILFIQGHGHVLFR